MVNQMFTGVTNLNRFKCYPNGLEMKKLKLILKLILKLVILQVFLNTMNLNLKMELELFIFLQASKNSAEVSFNGLDLKIILEK